MPATILLVDDDSEFREELRAYLEGYDVVEASSGAQAVGFLKRPNEIDLVILDVMMPGMNGTEVLREMKRLDPGLGIIMLTGFSSKDVAVEALQGRADDYVEKTYDIGRIKEVIERLLEARYPCRKRNSRSERTKVERAADYLKRNCYTLTRLADAARVVSLSPKYLSRIFKQHMHIGFAAYRQRLRVAEGKRLLDSTDLTVAEIADRLGCKNPESFIRVFKRLAGATPSAYRRKTARPRKTKKRTS